MNKFFHYPQNNSGGYFTDPAQHVVIEARDADEANEIAEANGLYFGGVSAGRDCECCGNRWSMAYGEGDNEPLVYGSVPDENALVIRKA